MKKIYLSFVKGVLPLLLLVLGSASVQAQVTDTTNVINPPLTGRHLVHSSVTFHDGDENGIFDAVFTLSEGPIAAWGDYVIGVVFYETGIRVKNGLTGQHPFTNELIPVDGQSYDIWVAVDMDTQLYSTWVQTEGLDEPLLIFADAGFNNTTVTTLDTWSAIHNPDGQNDSLTVESFELTTNSDPSLASLSANLGEMYPEEFDPFVDAYELAVPYGTTQIQVNAVANGMGAQVEIIDNNGNTVGEDGLVAFEGDGVDLEIQVTAIDGTAFTYILSIFVDDGSSDATLDGLTASTGVIAPSFSGEVTSYTITVPVGTTSVELTGIPNYPQAVVTGAGEITLSNGSATTTVVCTSFDGSTTKEYEVVINEADGNNYALQLAGVNGNNSHMNISGLDLKTLPYTVEMWIKPDGTQAPNTGLFYNRSTQGHAGVQYSSNWQTGGRLRAMTNIDGDYGVLTEVIPTSGWQHVAAVITENSRTIYHNGTEYTEAKANAAFDFSLGSLFVGWDSDLADRAFKGAIDEVRIWSDSLSQETLMANRYEVLNGDEASLVAYWNFDLASPAQAFDWTGNGLLAEIKGGTIVESFSRANTYLGTLSVTGEDAKLYPEVHPDRSTYFVIVKQGVESFELNVVPESAAATVSGGGVIAVDGTRGEATFSVSESGDTREYTIKYMVEDDFELRHSYTFADGTARDVVGEAHGTIMGGSIVEGAFVAAEEGDYIALDAASIAINNYTSFTVELYFVASDGVNGDTNTIMAWFGATNPDNNYGVDGLLFTHKSRAAISTANPTSPWGTEDGVNSIMLDDGMPHYMVATVTNDSLVFFVNGTKIGAAELRNANKIFNLSNADAFLAKGGYGNDATWKGSILEYNIYSGVMSDAMVAQRYLDFPLEDGSADASLAELMVDGELLSGFSPYTYEYVVPVESETAEPFITAFATNENAQVEVVQADGIPGVATVTVTSVDGENEVVYTINFELPTTSIGEVKEPVFEVVPTVGSGSFTIKSSAQAGRYILYDLSGRQVLNGNILGGETSFEVQQAGVYILRVETAEGQQVVKIVKK